MIPLTLRAMLGSRRHPSHGWDQSVFVLLSVLALLAFALFPVAASADSAGAEYQNAVPTPYGGTHKAPTVVGGGDEEDKAHASKEGGGTGGTGSGSDGGSSEGGDAGTPAGQGPGGDKGGNGSTNSQHQNGGKDAANNKVANFEEVPSPNAESDDGGSSPLVPILIVIALLAAISVGVVVWQRRRGDTPPITPKAG
jgi:cobalamin biosynthesis Mg chelatase CobN